jgi:myo-inositol-1-phosphate synthase
MAYVNFTPSPGATPAAIGELGETRGTCHAGQDGKTGETLMKSVLAPMFAARNLEVVERWVSFLKPLDHRLDRMLSQPFRGGKGHHALGQRETASRPAVSGTPTHQRTTA